MAPSVGCPSVLCSGGRTPGGIYRRVEPHIRRYVRTRLDFKGEGGGDGPQICPGEDECEPFQATAGKTREIKERNICVKNCPYNLYETKINPNASSERDALIALVDRVGGIRQHRLAGFVIDSSMMTELEYRILMEMEDHFTAHKDFSRFAQIETYRLVRRFFESK
jgi:hypothetical protein